MIVVPNTFKEIDRRVTFADPLKFSDHTKGAQMDTEGYGILRSELEKLRGLNL